MEQILSKLSEIETTANFIMEEASRKQQEMSRQLEEQCRSFDAQVDADTAKQVSEIRRQLEKDKEQELSKLRSQTEASFAEMDAYYAHNHEKLAKQIYDKILKG